MKGEECRVRPSFVWRGRFSRVSKTFEKGIFRLFRKSLYLLGFSLHCLAYISTILSMVFLPIPVRFPSVRLAQTQTYQAFQRSEPLSISDIKEDLTQVAGEIGRSFSYPEAEALGCTDIITNPLDPSLATGSWWSFDGDGLDHIGNLSATIAAPFGPGNVGSALDTGEEQVAALADVNVLKGGPNGLTVEAWLWLDPPEPTASSTVFTDTLGGILWESIYFIRGITSTSSSLIPPTPTRPGKFAVFQPPRLSPPVNGIIWRRCGTGPFCPMGR